MKMNPKISGNINQWDVEFDPYDFILNKDWIFQSEKTEDLLQIQHVYGRLTIDVGYYESYRAVIIVDREWDTPLEVFESDDGAGVNETVCKWIDAYANWDE